MKHSRFASLIACMVGFSSCAFAGHYECQTKTSGLTFTASPGGGSPTYGYGAVTGSVGGGAGSCSISGSVTTTFTWVKDKDGSGNTITNDLPPDSVIAIESCSVSTDAKTYISSGGGTPGGSSNNGLGSDWTTTTSPAAFPIVIYGGGMPITIGYEKMTSSTGTKATILTGGNSVTVTSSPSASASSGSGTYSAGITYSVSVYPVTVSVAGTLAMPDTSLEILPGQQATGSLGLGGSGLTVKSGTYQWGVTGDTFKSYSASDTSGLVTPMATGDWQVASPAWRWTAGINDTVTCTAELLYAPSGYSSKSVGSVTATKSVAVIAPNGNMTATLGGSGHGQLISPVGLTSKPSGAGNAVYILYEAMTPSEFSTAQGDGTIGYVQLLTNTNYSADGTVVKTSNIVSTPPDPLDNIALDNGYPYPFCDGYVAANTSTSGSGYDTPFFEPTGIGAGLLTTLETTLTAKGYSLFKAPGGTSQPVPCQYFVFTWNASASKSGGTWSMASNDTVITVSPDTGFIHPQWKHKWTN